MRRIIFLTAIITFLGTFNCAIAQFNTVSDGVNWQRTIRVMNVFPPFDPYNELMLYEKLGINPDELKISRDFVHEANVAGTFWTVLRDSLNEAIKSDAINVYNLRPSTIRGQDFIYVKDEQIPNDQLFDFLTNSYEGIIVGNNPTHTGAVISALDTYVYSEDRGIQSANDNIQNYEDLQDINLFQLEAIIYVDETGFGIKPTKLIMAPALFQNPNVAYPFRIDEFQDDPSAALIDQFPVEIAFMVDLTEEESIDFLTQTGLRFSGEFNVMSFYDLLTMFHFDYFYYSVSNIALRGVDDGPFLDLGYDIDELRLSTMNNFNDIKFTQIYGEVPQWWLDNNRGGLTNGLFEVNEDALRERGLEVPGNNEND